MPDVLAVYPELAGRIGALCGENSWGISGASALVYDDEAFYLEVTHPKHWQRLPDGRLKAGLGAIGGSVEGDESVLECLYREMAEEVDAGLQVESAEETLLVYEERVADTVRMPQRDLPVPALCTISANLYRRQHHPQWQTLVIVTFLARAESRPTPLDLFGLVRIPRAHLADALTPDQITIEHLRAIPGVGLTARENLPGDLALAPVWTIRSLQQLLWEGRLPYPTPPL
ncbi:MAG: NUDIX hydrolase [Anaerolineae bacterium]